MRSVGTLHNIKVSRITGLSYPVHLSKVSFNLVLWVERKLKIKGLEDLEFPLVSTL